MERPSSTNSTDMGIAKASDAPPPPPVGFDAAPNWDKAEKLPQGSAPPPVWARYIDSRLKQFCTR